MNSPCLNCSERKRGCHAYCTAYGVYVANNVHKRDERMKEMALDEMDAKRHERALREQDNARHRRYRREGRE